MSADVIVTRLRSFLLMLASALCAGIIIELGLTGHFKELVQFVPFTLCGLGLIALLAVLFRPNRTTLWALRIIMLIAALGGLLGVYEHLSGNLEFAQEVKAAQAANAPLKMALTGANPPLAPGALVVTAMIAGAATYFHPALKEA